MFSVGDSSATWARQSKLNVFFQTSVVSTNDWAKEKAFGSELATSPISLFLTEEQTHGRGRGNHSWSQNSPSSALLSSWVFELPRPPRSVVTCRIGLAVEKALTATWPWLHFSLKAPNDIYIGKKKLGGILVENLQQGKANCLIIGLGLNVFESPDLPLATSLFENLKDERFLSAIDWEAFLDRLFLELSLAVSLSAEALSSSEQMALLSALNKKVDLPEKFISVEADGTLITAQNRIHWSEL